MTVVALDVGGTLMKGAVVERDGRSSTVRERPTPRGEHTVTGILDFIADLAATAGTPAAIGLAVPGIVDETTGVARYSTNLAWRDLPLRDLATQRFNLPVALVHDVRSGALAEALFGAATGVRDFLFLPIGTGIAGTVFVDGTPYPGAAGMAGEIGHAPVHVGDEPCACGQRGCLEAYASASALVRRYGDPNITAADVVARATAGDPAASAVLADAIAALAFALTTYTMLLDPTLIVLGGGLSQAGDTLLTPLREQFSARLAWRTAPDIVTAALGTSAGRLGAAVAAWRLIGQHDWTPA